MQVSQVCKPAFWIDNGEVYVQITIWMLRFPNHVDQLCHGGFNLLVVPCSQVVACSFNPFSNIRVPEQVKVVVDPQVWIGFERISPAKLEPIVSARFLQLVELGVNGGFPHDIALLGDEGSRKQCRAYEGVLRVVHGLEVGCKNGIGSRI